MQITTVRSKHQIEKHRTQKQKASSPLEDDTIKKFKIGTPPIMEQNSENDLQTNSFYFNSTIDDDHDMSAGPESTSAGASGGPDSA